MKKNLKKVMPLIIVLIFIIGTLIFYGLVIKDRKSNKTSNNNVVSIKYDASSEDLDFSNYDTVEVTSIKDKYEKIM